MSSDQRLVSNGVQGRKAFFSFPDPVDDAAARTVAAGVVLQVALLLITRDRLLLIPLCYGFMARVLSGPKISPLGLIATRIVAPRLKALSKPVPGKPKRFAQGIGAIMSLTAAILSLTVSSFVPAAIVLVFLGAAATLEAAAGFCLGCKLFALLFRIGLVGYDDCPNCVLR
ncbi:MAG: DUF4395 domain-containing protein [Actinomycetota bacterium]|nr:DUF4395 domain-containing protein [Actinomycetota bacterium]MDA8398022.1 DUF4395 domain-containing protein [Actinomycetota bacterium]